MPSVLLITLDLERAGAQRQCLELALGLQRESGWNVEVAAVEPGGPLSQEFRQAGIPLHDCPRRWRWDLSPAATIAMLVRRRRFDVVHSFLFVPNFYGRAARLLFRPRVLISSLRSTGIGGWHRYLAEILMAPLCDAIIANSEAGKAHLVARGVSRNRVLVVQNGVDLTRFTAVRAGATADGRRRVGMVAQMEARKDTIGLVEAFSRLREEFPEMLLVLAGDGRLRPAVEEKVRCLGLGRSVVLLGTVDDPTSVYPTLDIYVQASAREEGTSNSILEAMASGLPVVATDIGGNREVVRHGETGLIVPAHDPEALRGALRELLLDPSRGRRMGAAGSALVHERFSRQTMVRSTMRIYERLLAAHREGPARTGSETLPIQ